jgi:hypothetical protein
MHGGVDSPDIASLVDLSSLRVQGEEELKVFF